jgi:malectin (di-glucose binding ER protein)
VLALLLVGAATLLWAHFRTSAQPAREVWRGSSAEPVPGEFRMLAGYQGQPFTDRQGRTWQPDAYYSGGVSVPLPADRNYEAMPDPGLAKCQREGDFQYAIPVRQGTYEVHLYFVETRRAAGPDAPGLFHISVNGNPVLNSFDVLSEAGAANRLVSRVFSDVTPSADGRIHLAFEQRGRKPTLTALEILSSKPGRVRPVRIVAARDSVTDSDGSLWMADEYAVGGMLVERKDSIRDSELKILYAGEHYGNFAYHIPLPPAKYRVKLYFAETYFGSKLPFSGEGRDEIGARVFNVFFDGKTLLRNFDITREAGGSNRAVVKTFDNLEPNAQGKIVLEFVPVVNYAEVNAIEVTQME